MRFVMWSWHEAENVVREIAMCCFVPRSARFSDSLPSKLRSQPPFQEVEIYAEPDICMKVNIFRTR